MSLTRDIDPAFDRAFLDSCAQIRCNPLHLLAVMSSESAIRASAENPHGGASGLIQFMPKTLAGLGWKGTGQEFRALSASGQLPYVVAYYRWFESTGRGKEGTWESAARLYQATFLPGTLGTSREPEDTIAAKGGRLGFAYDANAVFDANGDERITIRELDDAVRRAARTPRFLEMVDRLRVLDPSLDAGREEPQRYPDGRLRIDTILDVQHALNAIYDEASEGWVPLVEDGLLGPKTTAAVRAFQEAHDLHVDGIAGRKTRAALADLLG